MDVLANGAISRLRTDYIASEGELLQGMFPQMETISRLRDGYIAGETKSLQVATIAMAVLNLVFVILVICSAVLKKSAQQRLFAVSWQVLRLSHTSSLRRSPSCTSGSASTTNSSTITSTLDCSLWVYSCSCTFSSWHSCRMECTWCVYKASMARIVP